MKTLIKSVLFVAFALSANSASACTIVAAEVIGHDNFVDLDASGCSQTSLYMNGSYSLADIINRFGTIVTGIYGNGHHYTVRNYGDNEVAILVDGNWHMTTVRTQGNFNEVQTQQNGQGKTELDVNIDGDVNRLRTRQNGNSRLKVGIEGTGNDLLVNVTD